MRTLKEFDVPGCPVPSTQAKWGNGEGKRLGRRGTMDRAGGDGRGRAGGGGGSRVLYHYVVQRLGMKNDSSTEERNGGAAGLC